MISKIGEISGGHSGAIYDLAYDGEKLFSASADGFVARWNINTLEQDTFSIKCSTPPYSIGEAEHFLWFGLSSGDIHVVDLEQKKEIKFFQQHRHAIFSIEYIPSKSLIIIGDADGNISIWDANKLTLLLFLPLNCGKIRKINSKQDGELFVIHGQDGKVRIFETNNFNEIVTLPGHDLGACCSAFSPFDSALLISGGKDGHLKIWNWQDEELVQSIPAHNFAIYDLAINEDTATLISISRDKSIKSWDAKTFEFDQKIDLKSRGHKHSVNALCLIKNNQFITASDDQKMMIWQLSAK